MDTVEAKEPVKSELTPVIFQLAIEAPLDRQRALCQKAIKNKIGFKRWGAYLHVGPSAVTYAMRDERVSSFTLDRYAHALDKVIQVRRQEQEALIPKLPVSCSAPPPPGYIPQPPPPPVIGEGDRIIISLLKDMTDKMREMIEKLDQIVDPK